MKNRKSLWTSLIASAGLIILILDARTALTGAKEGISLCINTVIPSLFPFFVLSSIVNTAFMGKEIKILRPIGKLCGIPNGGESLLLLGLIGGYPVGAQGIEQAYVNGYISNESAKRMLGFCNNAGPAFIFGMLSGLFENKVALWILWGIHIFSALITGILLPNKTNTNCKLPEQKNITLSESVRIGIKTMAQVCAWVVLFRVILAFCSRWFLWILANEIQVIFFGLLELSNGSIALYDVANSGLRFILCACFLSFGGLCVAMQTISVTRKSAVGYYFPGKIIQTFISLILSSVLQLFLFDVTNIIVPSWLPIPILLVGVIYLSIEQAKKVVAIPG